MKPIHLTIACVLALAACNLPATRSVAPFPELPRAAPHPTMNAVSVPADFLTGIRLVSHDPFDSLQGWKQHAEGATLEAGVFALPGTPRWQSSIWNKLLFGQGDGLIVTFRVQNANANSEFVLVTGDWLTDTFRQFGVYNNAIPKADLFLGIQNLGGSDLAGNLRLLPGTWYNLLLIVGRDGHMLAVVWDPADEAQRAVFDMAAGSAWSGRSWVFLPKATMGETVFLDDFYRLSFADIK